MKTELIFKAFGYGKSINEILYQINCWENEFDFIKKENSFIIKLLESDIFNSNTPNLFERIQQFLKDLSSTENTRNTLLIELDDYKNDLMGQDEKHHFETHNYYLIAYQKMAESIFNYFKNYKALKSTIYEYVEGVMISKNEIENKI